METVPRIPWPVSWSWSPFAFASWDGALGTGYVWRAGVWQVRAYGRIDSLFDQQYAGSGYRERGKWAVFRASAGSRLERGHRSDLHLLIMPPLSESVRCAERCPIG